MINTILSVSGIDLKTLRPMPTVEGHSVPGGYSGQAVRPIALRQVMEVARANPGVAISGIGGIETGFDAAQFFLLGASTVQVCTGAMLRGYEIISELKEELVEVHDRPQVRRTSASSSARACRTSRRTTISSIARRRRARPRKRARVDEDGEGCRDLEGRHREGNLDAGDELRSDHGAQSLSAA